MIVSFCLDDYFAGDYFYPVLYIFSCVCRSLAYYTYMALMINDIT
jgi:hypothetical protein